MYMQLADARLFFDIDGAGWRDGSQREALFLLHGGPGGDHTGLKTPAFDFREWAQLVYVDHRGCGQSKPAPRESCTLEQNIQDIEALRAHLGLERIALLGYSYGGMVAQGYAIRHPSHTTRLILLATAPSHGFITEARAFVTSHGTYAQQAICRHLWDGTFASDEQLREYYRLMGPLYSQTFDEETFAAAWRPNVTNLDALNLGFGGFLRHFDWRPRLHEITCPTLILSGRHDWITSAAQGQVMADRIPGAHFIVMENSGHLIPTDEPEAFHHHVSSFLRQAPA